VGAEKTAQLADDIWVHVRVLPALRVLQTLVCRVVLDAVKSYRTHNKYKCLKHYKIDY
jgi:hypothetical protein